MEADITPPPEPPYASTTATGNPDHDCPKTRSILFTSPVAHTLLHASQGSKPKRDTHPTPPTPPQTPPLSLLSQHHAMCNAPHTTHRLQETLDNGIHCMNMKHSAVSHMYIPLPMTNSIVTSAATLDSSRQTPCATCGPGNHLHNNSGGQSTQQQLLPAHVPAAPAHIQARHVSKRETYIAI